MTCTLMTVARIGLALLCISVGQGAAAADNSPAGRYRMSEGPDVASELILAADGRFTYFLAAGSLDEHSAGQWRIDGKTLRLTTNPKPVPPTFAAGPITRLAEGIVTLHVVSPRGDGIAAIDLKLGFDQGEPVEAYTQDYGWSLSPNEARKNPRWVEFAVPMFQLQSQRFPLDLSRGNDFTFVLTPNDLGLVDFTDMPAAIVDGEIIIKRGPGEMIFKPARQ